MVIDKRKEYRAKQRQKAQNYIRAVAMFHGCQMCPEKDYICIDFHHKNPSEKEGDVHLMVRNKWSSQTIRKELKKCVTLCSNCHKKLHNKMLTDSKCNDMLRTLDENVLISIEKLVDTFGFDNFKETFLNKEQR